MTFALKSGEAVGDGVRRLILRAVDRALGAILDPAGDQHKAVHAVRRRCNEVRSLLRLARGSLDPALYTTENARFRDLRHRLGGARDRAAALEAFDRLYESAPPEADRGLILPLRHALAAERDRAPTATEAPDLARVGQSLAQARDSLAAIKLSADGFDAIAEGFTDSYRRARKGMAKARQSKDVDAFHEWRKQVKHHRQHLRVLRPVWPVLLKPLAREGAQLAIALGDEHDLAVLALVLNERKAEDDREAVRVAQALIARQRKILQMEAIATGRRLFAETPKAACRRVKGWTEAWIAEEKSMRNAKKKIIKTVGRNAA
jgi:CHAD domain-containing protein